MKNILIVNPFGIGDVLFTMPVVEALKERIEGVRIGYLCNRRTEPLLRSDPRIDWVFVYEKDELKQLRRESKTRYIGKLFSLINGIRSKHFDVAIDLSLNREYGFLCWFTGIRERIGFNYRSRGAFLTKRIDINGYHDRHITEYYLGLLRFMGVRPAGKQIKIFIPEEDMKWARENMRSNGIREGDIAVGISPAGGASWGKEAAIKHWHSRGFAELADRLVERLGAKVIILGSASESEICDKMAKTMKDPAISACGKTTLMQSAALMSLCGLVIANDGGLLHLAVAAGARTVGIFGPVDERVYGQYPPGEKHRAVKTSVICRPCYRNFKLKECADRRCLGNVSVDSVFNAAKEALAAR